MTTPDSKSKEYLRDVISLVTLLSLLCHLYLFHTLLPNTLLKFRYKSSPNIEHSKQLMEQDENVTMAMSSSVTYLRIDNSTVNSLCLLCPKFQLVTWQTTKKISSDFSLNSVSKWCWFVKTMHKCQNGGEFKMSKWCRYV